MEIFQLENDCIRIKINSMGAELVSLEDMASHREYMWSGDSRYWGRISPILFPVVGSCRNKQYRFQGETFSIPQHGFARDMEFMMTEKSPEELWFCLTDKENTWEAYPFAFALEVGYRIDGREVKVMWRVTNPAEKTMYFSIGGHPAFRIPEWGEGNVTSYMKFQGRDKLLSRGIQNGLAVEELKEIPLLEGGLLPVTEEVFLEDALVIENRQTGQMQLLDGEKNPFVTVTFDAPLFGVWTPSGMQAPFLCIEPWYGRCDKADFDGEISEREWGNELAAGEVFEAYYTIRI